MSLPPASTASFHEAWQRIVTTLDHTAQTWACIEAAVRNADAATAPALANNDRPFQRGGPVWCQIATTSYTFLRDTGAYSHLAVAPTELCSANVNAARTWLTTPLVEPERETSTTAQILDVDEFFLTDNAERPGRLAQLLEEAQDAGVLIIDGGRIQLWHTADDRGDPNGHRLAIRLHSGVVLASNKLQVDDFTDETLEGVEAAADALAQTSRIVNEILAKAKARQTSAPTAVHDNVQANTEVPSWVQGHRTPPGRAFPPPAITTTPTVTPPQPPPTSSHNSTRRRSD